MDDEEVLIDRDEPVGEDKESKPAAATDSSSAEPDSTEDNKEEEAALGSVPTLTRKNTPMPGKGEALDVMADVAAHMNYDDDDEEGEGAKPEAAKTQGAAEGEAVGTEEEKKAVDSTTNNEPESEETKTSAEDEVTVGGGAA